MMVKREKSYSNVASTETHKFQYTRDKNTTDLVTTINKEDALFTSDGSIRCTSRADKFYDKETVIEENMVQGDTNKGKEEVGDDDGDLFVMLLLAVVFIYDARSTSAMWIIYKLDIRVNGDKDADEETDTGCFLVGVKYLVQLKYLPFKIFYSMKKKIDIVFDLLITTRIAKRFATRITIRIATRIATRIAIRIATRIEIRIATRIAIRLLYNCSGKHYRVGMEETTQEDISGTGMTQEDISGNDSCNGNAIESSNDMLKRDKSIHRTTNQFLYHPSMVVEPYPRLL